MKPAINPANRIPLPDPIREERVSIDFATSATDKRTGAALERQAALMSLEPMVATLPPLRT
jgi:hypothetical protein